MFETHNLNASLRKLSNKQLDVWSSGVVGLFGQPVLCCLVLCACPLDVGIFYVFCALFCLPNVGQGYNYITLSVNCNSLCA